MSCRFNWIVGHYWKLLFLNADGQMDDKWWENWWRFWRYDEVIWSSVSKVVSWCFCLKAIFAESVLDGSTSMGVFLAIISVISTLVAFGLRFVWSKLWRPCNTLQWLSAIINDSVMFKNRTCESTCLSFRRNRNRIATNGAWGDMTNDFEGIFIELMRTLTAVKKEQPLPILCLMSQMGSRR